MMLKSGDVLARWLVFFGTLLSATLTHPGDACAEEQQAPRSRQPLRRFAPAALGLEGNVGLGTPLGFAGTAVDLSASEEASFNAGAGWGSDGLQLAAMVRLRRATEDLGLGIGLGVSRGPYLAGPKCNAVICDAGDYPRKQWDPAWWGNAELFVESRLSAPPTLYVRASLGIGAILNRDAGEQTLDYCGDGSPCGGFDGIPMEPIAPYLGVAVGYAFAL